MRRLFGSAKPTRLINSAGEAEFDCRSPRWNLLEALFVFGAIEVSIWGLVAELGMVRGSRHWLTIGNGILGLCALYVAVGSVWLHGDAAESWGLPRRGELSARLRDVGQKAATRRMLVLLGCGITLAVGQGWPNLLARLGIRRHFLGTFEWFTTTAEGLALGIGAGVLMLLTVLARVVRWENLANSTRTLAPVALGLWLTVLALAFVYACTTGDSSGLQARDWLAIHPDRTSVIFYLLWGFVQQGIFLGYFNTRIRKGIGPRPHGALLSALLTGVVFGIAHLPSLPLAMLTTLEGTLLAWYFQSAATRNLFVMAAIHAVAGTLFSAMLPVSTNVGPW